MNFGRFTDRIKESAEAATAAARTFKGFDDMAAQDDYIHSENLNVKSTSSKPAKTVQEHTETSQQHDLSSSSRSWSLLDQPRHSTPNSDKQEADLHDIDPVRQPRPWDAGSVTEQVVSAKAATRSRPGSSHERIPHAHRQSTMPLLSVVADTLSKTSAMNGGRQSGMERKRESNVSSMSNSIDNSKDSSQYDLSDEEDEDDPIMSLIRKNPVAALPKSRKKTISPPSRKENRMQFLEMEEDSPSSNRNPNRFMQELDNRMSMPELNDEEKGLLTMGYTGSSRQDHEPAKPTAWLWGMVSGRPSNLVATPTVVQPKAAPLSRQSRVTPQQQQDHPNFSVTASSVVLGEDEIQALAQLKLSTKQDPFTAFLDKIKRCKREGFIVFTLVLSWGVYLYSRKRSIEDVN